MREAKHSEIRKGTPFRYALRNDFPGRHGKLMRLAKDGHVVRVLQRWTDADIENLKTFTQALRQDGLRVPRYDVLLAPRWDRPGKAALYIVTESIGGERLDEIARPSQLDWELPVSRQFYNAFYDTVDRFITQLMTYYLRAMNHGGLLFSAMDESQFLYGASKVARQPDVYFVDLDPTYKVFNAKAGASAYDEAKTYFEKPINILFEMELLHPEAPFPISKRSAIDYFRTCSAAFTDFYSKSTPWWGRAPNFEHYQRMKTEMLSA